MLRPGSFVSRLTAVTLLVLLLLAGHQLLVQPVIDHYWDNRAEIERSRDLLTRYRQLAAEHPSLADHLAAMEEDRQRSSGYINAISDALAAAAIQDHVAGTIAETQGDIKSLQILPAEEVDGQPTMRRIGLKLRFAASLDGLAGALHRLESGTPSLFVDELVVTASGSGLTSTDATRAPELDIKLQIFGYARDGNYQSASRDESERKRPKQGLRTEIQQDPRARVQRQAVDATKSTRH